MKLKGSVAIVALVTSSILVVLSLMLIRIVHFNQFNQYRFSRKMAAQWFLEGRMNEYLDGVVNAGRLLKEGRFPFTEKINGKNQSYVFQITRLSAQNWQIEASMLWQKEIPVTEKVVIHRISAFTYSFVFKETKPWKVSKTTLFSGNVRVEAPLKVDVSEGVRWYGLSGSDDYADVLSGVYLSAQWVGGVQSEILGVLLNGGSLDSVVRMRQPQYRFLKENLSLPTYTEIFRAYQNFFDSSWVIDDFTFYDTKEIVNDLDVYKLKIDDGNGYRIGFIAGEDKPSQVYISSTSGGVWHRIFSPDESYGYGQNTRGFLAYDLDKLILKASSEKTPVVVELPEGAYEDFARIHLRSKESSVISVYEKPAYVAFNQTDQVSRYYSDRDFVYDSRKGVLSFTSSRFFANFVRSIGVGTGSRYRFELPGIHGNFGVYVNGKRVKVNARDQVSVTLQNAPPKGSEILVWIYPSVFFLSKRPPSPQTAVYKDPKVEAVVLDLGEMQNYPTHSVIYSKLPLYITGKARENLVILCDRDVYLGSINAEDEGGGSVLVASATGVWGLLPDMGQKPLLRHVMIVSPLDVFPVVNPGESYGGGQFTILGSLILSGVENSRVMNVPQELPNLLSDAQVKRDGMRFPFSLFPFPVRILSVKRQ